MTAAALPHLGSVDEEKPLKELQSESGRERRGSGQPSQTQNISDDGLTAMVRNGKAAAFGELYFRYAGLARYVARIETDNASDAEDIVSEGFAAIFQSLKDGGGPQQSFRPYLLTTVRRMAHRRNVQARRTLPVDRHSLLAEEAMKGWAGADSDETAVLISALRSLPARWQAVLWYSVVETMKPADISQAMGLSPNAVSALLKRARDGLRRAYLQIHVVQPVDNSCEAIASQLGRFVLSEGRMPGHDTVRRHIDQCRDCAAALATLSAMRKSMKDGKRSN